jgi:hypothetical protein
MANKIALIQKYSPEILDEIFQKEAVTAVLERDTGLLKFTSAKTVLIPSMELDGLGDYTRANQAGYGYPAGSVDVKWESHTLTKDRGKQFMIDSMDDEETAGLVVGALLDQFVRTKEVPEVDAYRLSKLYQLAYNDQIISETISANTIISKFNTAFEKFADLEIPEDEQVLFVSNQVMTLIRNTTELDRRIQQQDYRNPAGLTFTVNMYDGRPIIAVPARRFYTGYTFGANGFTPVAGAKLMNFMLVHFNAALPIKKHEVLKVFGPEVVQDFDGFKLNHRLYHDIFVPLNKRVAIYVSVSGVDALISPVSFKTEAGAATNGTIITGVYTAGVRGTVKYLLSTTAVGSLALPAYGASLSSYTALVEGQEIAASTNVTIIVAVADESGNAIAAGKATIVKKTA